MKAEVERWSTTERWDPYFATRTEILQFSGDHLRAFAERHPLGRVNAALIEKVISAANCRLEDEAEDRYLGY